jgi:hypothetical protein
LPAKLNNIKKKSEMAGRSGLRIETFMVSLAPLRSLPSLSGVRTRGIAVSCGLQDLMWKTPVVRLTLTARVARIWKQIPDP